jgi:DNA-binding transcriptional LysR family regulator
MHDGERSLDWDLLRTFEVVARQGSLTAAAKALRVSQSTVSRQLAKLEALAGSPLLLRDSPVTLTDRGAALLVAIEPMVDAALAAAAALDERGELRGLVTITTVGELLRWAVVARLPEFHARHPLVRLRLLADNHVASLAAGEADLALRFARPQRGELVARRLRSESYALFVHRSLPLDAELPWLGLGGSLATIPEQRWAEQAFVARAPRLLIEDVEGLGLAVAAGLGVAVLPRNFAARLEGVVEVAAAQVGARELGPIPSRDLWLVVHRAKQHLPQVRAVMTWLAELLR